MQYQELSEQYTVLKKKEREFDEVVGKVMEMKSQVDDLTTQRNKLTVKNENLDTTCSVQSQELTLTKEENLRHRLTIVD